MIKVAVIGGGAAGFFAALSCKLHYPEAEVSIIEKSGKTLAKVKVSGGGRCNVTNGCESKSDFLKHYPRGNKSLKKTFNHFNREQTINWFLKRGVVLKEEDDGRMFPVTNDSQTIIDCLRNEAQSNGVKVVGNCSVLQMVNLDKGFNLYFKNGQNQYYDHVIVATGGSPKLSGYKWLSDLGLKIIDPVPSLFTFNITEEAKLKSLMGLAVPKAFVKIQGTKLAQEGPVLLTHWGMSGPAILRLSAWGARQLAELVYQFNIQVNWTSAPNEEFLRKEMAKGIATYPKKKVINARPFDIPNRLWEYLLDRIDLDVNKVWHELGKKEKNRLINILFNDQYQVSGKTTFKEEFVTCGGVDLGEVDFNTMECRKVPGLYLAGEVLNVDGVTGGFNFQAAWSTGFVAGKLGG